MLIGFLYIVHVSCFVLILGCTVILNYGVKRLVEKTVLHNSRDWLGRSSPIYYL